MPPRTRRTTKPAVATEVADDVEPAPAPRRRRPAAKPTAEVESVEEPAPKPVRRRRTAANPVIEQPVEEIVDEPVAKPVRRRLTSVKPTADEAEVVTVDDPTPKPVRRRKSATTTETPPVSAKRAAKPVAADDDEKYAGMTPGQIKMAKLRAMRKPRDPNAPKPKPKQPAKPPIEFGTAWLVEHVSEIIEKPVDSFGVRGVLRKLARKGVLERVVGEDRGRYEFTGPDDPGVVAVIAEYKSGAVDTDKKTKLAALPKKPITKPKPKPAAKPAAPAKRGRKPKPVLEPVDVEPEFDDDEYDELED